MTIKRLTVPWGMALLLLLSGCPEGDPQHTVLLSLDYQEKGRLPVSPHVLRVKAKPTPEMIAGSVGIPLRYMILDKRTLSVHRLVVPTGERVAAPWGGWLRPTAFIPDLVIRDGVARHGPEGHVNPVAWTMLEDSQGEILHEGWTFARDSAQTAWDHPRYDVTFLGVKEAEPPNSSDP